MDLQRQVLHTLMFSVSCDSLMSYSEQSDLVRGRLKLGRSTRVPHTAQLSALPVNTFTQLINF